MADINEKMKALGGGSNAIRSLFEYGQNRAKEIGRENVYDFSLGNPSIPIPQCVHDELNKLAKQCEESKKASIKLHGYTSGVGAEEVRIKIADDICERFSFKAEPSDIYVTCGAAAAIAICFQSIIASPDEEVIIPAPFFPEYTVFAEKAGAKVCIVPPDEETFFLNIPEIKKAVNENTKAVIINSPNNPSGAIFPEDNIIELCKVLKEAEEKYGHVIYLISDEPYRELVYDGQEVPYLPKYYDDTFVCYSFSKSLSMPGDRIGYIFVSPKMKNQRDVFDAVCGSGRALGYVCAPTMAQYVVAECLGKTADNSVYKRNRDKLYGELTGMGYQCVHPDGAFYLLVKAPNGDGDAFSEKAKKYDLLLVPARNFGCAGYVRLCYCVSENTIIRSLPAFKKLIEDKD